MNVAVIGLGQIGMGYDLALPPSYILSHARAYAVHDAFCLVAGIDLSEERRRKFEETYLTPAYADFAEVPIEVDLVVLATPTDTHLDGIRNILGHHAPRVILCEKPLANTPAEAKEMVALCAARGIHLFVNYMRRCEPGAREIRRRILERAIIPPVKGVVWYSKGLMHNGSHFIDLLQHWLGPITETPHIFGARSYGIDDVEADIRLTFQNGEVLFLSCDEKKFSHHTVELISPSGRLRYEDGGAEIVWQPAQQSPVLGAYRELGPKTMITSDLQRALFHVAEEIHQVVTKHNQNTVLCDGSAGLHTVATIAEIMHRANH